MTSGAGLGKLLGTMGKKNLSLEILPQPMKDSSEVRNSPKKSQTLIPKAEARLPPIITSDNTPQQEDTHIGMQSP